MSGKKLRFSELFKRYLVRVSFRCLVFLFVAGLYFYNKDLLDFTLIKVETYSFEPMHLFWLIILIEMLMQISPRSIVSKGCLKQFKKHFVSANVKYTKKELRQLAWNKDKGALKVIGSWCILNSFIGILFYYKLIGVAELILICAFFYLSDLICVMFFCPFQKFFMKNKCCVTCRIFAWGHIMMTTPLVFVIHPYSWSLVAIALFIALQWEYTYRTHPERFFEQTNASLKCKNCSDRMCIIKKR